MMTPPTPTKLKRDSKFLFLFLIRFILAYFLADFQRTRHRILSRNAAVAITKTSNLAVTVGDCYHFSTI